MSYLEKMPSVLLDELLSDRRKISRHAVMRFDP